MNPGWVLITGATSGIGKSFAFRFAAEGRDLILIARRTETLAKVSKELQQKYSIQIIQITADLAQLSDVNRALQQIQNKRLFVETLINNAGFAIKGAFAETPLEEELRMVQLQISTLLTLTKACLPEMIKNKKGTILNVGSVYSYSPVPYQSVYAASKAFMMSFSEALMSETDGTGVQIMILCPGVTSTEFRLRAGIKESKGILPSKSPDDVAAYAFHALTHGERIVIPGLLNQFFVFMGRHIPQRLRLYLIKVINQHRGVHP